MLLGTGVEAVILAMEDLVLRLAIIGSLPGPDRESSCTASIRLRPSPVSVRRDAYLQPRALLATLTLILQDLLRGGEIWLVDETMEKSAPRGVEMAARLLQPESFAMTARIIVPVTSDLMEEAFTRAPALQRTQGDTLARDPRFAIGIYRAAVLTGAMGSVRFKS